MVVKVSGLFCLLLGAIEHEDYGMKNCLEINSNLPKKIKV